jgi:hypothetical protein
MIETLLMIGMVAILALMAIIVLLNAVYGGWEAAIKIAATQGGLAAAAAIQWENVDFEMDNQIKEVITGGSRSIYAAKETILKHVFKMDRAYEDWTTLATLANAGLATALTTYWLGIYPTGYSAGLRKIEISFKVNKYKLSMKANDVNKESADFTVITCSTGTI